MPAYLSFFVFHVREIKNAPVPRTVIWALAALTLLVMLQSLNPNVPNWMVAAIGAKVWLFYIPIMFLTAAYLRTRDDLTHLLRLLVVLAIVPCVIGIVQWFGSITYGYKNFMTGFYGEAARGATQNFATHAYGGLLYRIPSTFTFVSQYFGFTLGMIVFAYSMQRSDPNPKWRRFGAVMIAFFVLASVLSGARGALVFVPLILVLMTFIDRRLTGFFAVAAFLPVIVLTAFTFVGIDPELFFGETSLLIGHYGDEIVYRNIINALVEYPFGIGIGMNTGAARHAFASEAIAGRQLLNLENFYAKAIVELGFIGAVAVLSVFLSIIFAGLRIRERLRDPGLQGIAASVIAFFITISIHSTKGWQIDYDPLNVYIWVFAGMMFKLPRLEANIAHAGAPHGQNQYIRPAGRRAQSRPLHRAPPRP
ncbi:MAG: O-antigen ligase family protein [Alphaproteobacteria bacterium]